MLSTLKQSLALSGNIRVLAATNFLTGSHIVMLIVILQPFTLSLGVSVTILGALQSISSLFGFGILGSIAPLLGGWLADRSGRRRVAILGSLLTVIALGFFLAASYTKSWLWLIPAHISFGFSFVGFPARLSIVAESIEPERRSMAYSTIVFFYVLPGTFTSLLSGAIVERYGYTIVFALGIAFEAATLTLLVMLLRETMVRNPSGAGTMMRYDALKRAIVPPPQLRGLFVTIAADSFAWGIGAAILYGIVKKTFGFTDFEIGQMVWASVIVFALFQLPIGKLMERRSRREFLVLSEIVGIVVMIGWLFAKDIGFFVALSLLQGLVGPTWVPAVNTILANSVARGERGAVLGQLAAFRGLISFPAPFIGGLLFDLSGYPAPILAGVLGVIATTGLIMVLVKEPKGAEVQL